MKTLLVILFPVISIVVTAQIETKQYVNETLDFTSLFNAKTNTAVACYRIPAIITAPNGDLIAAIDERVPSCGDLKWNKDINIVMRRSNDNGNTWSEILRVVDYPSGKSASDPSMILDKMTGAIFLFFNFMDLEHEKDVCYPMVMKSVDNGKTWSEPVDITSQITKGEWHNDFKFITSGRGMQTSSGKLIHTLVNLEKGLHLFGSNDHGESWYLIDVPVKPADESKLVELNDGSWMINSRVNGKGIRYVHLSHDEGKTWPEGKTIYAKSSAYSSMTILSNGDIGLLFEKDDYQEIVFARLTLHWLTDGKDEQNKP